MKQEDSIGEVSDHYKKYDPRWNMKPDERRKVIKYLRLGYTSTDICDAITGMFLSKFHCGNNKSKEKFIGLLYVFREHNFDKFRNLAEAEAKEAELRVRRQAEQDMKSKQDAKSRDEMERIYLSGFRYAKLCRNNGLDN